MTPILTGALQLTFLSGGWGGFGPVCAVRSNYTEQVASADARHTTSHHNPLHPILGVTFHLFTPVPKSAASRRPDGRRRCDSRAALPGGISARRPRARCRRGRAGGCRAALATSSRASRGWPSPSSLLLNASLWHATRGHKETRNKRLVNLRNQGEIASYRLPLSPWFRTTGECIPSTAALASRLPRHSPIVWSLSATATRLGTAQAPCSARYIGVRPTPALYARSRRRLSHAFTLESVGSGRATSILP